MSVFGLSLCRVGWLCGVAGMAGAAPVVDEVGPYSFVEKTSKYDIKFLEGGRLVQYVQLSQLSYTGPQSDLDKVGREEGRC